MVNGIPVVKVGIQNGQISFLGWPNISVTSVTIPNGVVSIGKYAFYGCDNLVSVSIPASVTSIGDYAFYSCTSLSSITVDSSNPSYSSDADGVLFNKDKTALIQYPVGRMSNSYSIPESVSRIESLAFHLCSNLVSVTIPNRLTSIGDSAFLSCINLAGVFMPNGVASIGNHAFAYCYGLINLILPSGVTSIASYAFTQCYQLASITIPSSVNWIGEGAFSGCTNLARAIFQGNAPSASSSSFSYTSTKIYYYPGKSGWGSSFAGQPTTQIISPSIKSIDLSASGVIQLSWLAIPDVKYTIQTTDNLANPFVARYTKNATNFLETWSDPESDSSGMRFYRVSLVQP